MAFSNRIRVSNFNLNYMLLMLLILIMTILQEEVNTADVGHDYAEDIKPAEGQDYAEEPYPKAKGKVEKKQKDTKVEGAGDKKGKVEKKGKDKAKSKSKHQKKGSGVNYSKKLNRQYLPTGCGFFGTIGCNRSIKWIFVV